MYIDISICICTYIYIPAKKPETQLKNPAHPQKSLISAQKRPTSRQKKTVFCAVGQF